MTWFVLARGLFVAAVGFSAYQSSPLTGGPLINLLAGLFLGGLFVLLEMRLRDTAVT